MTGQAQTLELSQSEQRWLLQHPSIRIAVDPDFAPFEWLDKGKQYRGISADYLALLEQKLGIKFELIASNNWSETLKLAQNGEVDLLPAIAMTAQRATYLRFTDIYQSTPGVVVSSKQYDSIEDLRERRVAVVRGYYWDDRLSNENPELQLQRVDDIQFAIELTALGAVDALVTDLASATRAIDQAGVSNLNVVRDPENKLGTLDLSMGVRLDWPELQALLNKALASISLEQRQQIQAKWIHPNAGSFWWTPILLYSLAAIGSLILLVLAIFFIWNRALTHKVDTRTRELRLAQDKLIQAEKMESIGRLAAGIAHEVKNPLAIIQMGIDYIAPEVPDNQTSREVLQDINEAVARADRVIHGLLDFSRDKQLTLAATDINEVIRDTLHLVEHELHQRVITAKTSLSGALPDIYVDSNKIQQVLINLFMNAAHAMQHEGELLIRSSLINANPQNAAFALQSGIFLAAEPAIRVTIEDTGPGIRPQDKEKIFELFYTTKAIGEGSGLGLSVTRNIIKLHHGSIEIDNRAEGGARVTILFKIQTDEIP